MSTRTKILRKIFAKVVPQADGVSRYFYALLFERHPELESLFAGADMKAQRDKLMQALAFLVANVDDSESLQHTLHALGARHVGYGVTHAYYPAFGECLLHTLKQSAGSAWTPDVAEAWADAIDTVTDLMVVGARSVAA